VQVGQADAACLIDFVDAPKHFTLVALVAFPDGDRRAPVTVPRNIPVAGILQPVAEAPVFHRFRHPVDLFVDRKHLFLDRFDAEIPGVHRLVDQRLLASPAVRVIVLDRSVRDDLPALAQETDDGRIRIDDVLFAVGAVEVRDLFGEAALCVDGVHEGHAVFLAGQ
jgi:hypothetical protein